MKTIRVVGMAAVAAATVLGTAACGGSSGGGAGASGGGGDIKIGFFTPKTGPSAPDGQSALAGATLAEKQVNDAGGVDGRKISLVTYDDASDPKQGASIATKLVTQDNVVAAVSGSYSPQTLAAAAIFQRNKVPMISAYAVNPGIPATGNFIFQADFNGVVQGRAGAQALADKKHAKKPAIIAIDNDFGKALVTGFKEQAQKLGMTVVSEARNQFGETSFEPAIRNAVAAGADSIYMVQYVAEGKQFLLAYQKVGADLPIMSTEGIDSAGFLDSIGDLANGVMWTTNLNRQSKAPATQAFLKDFKAANSFSPDMVAASSHDAVFLLVEGMKKGGVTPEEIQKGLMQVKDFTGATGTMSGFSPDRLVIKPVQLQLFQDGKIVSAGEISDPEILKP
ncbi:ABC transporter substrate-binding protein [Intrasporangium sp.]|uniref:ABC transporter substrate-binding protein n=1 Tax=Intrasporangium sp. TaxID=1925024 RepID=UPI003222209A